MSEDTPNEAPTEDLADLYENAPCGYLSMVPDGRIFRANATLAAWVGSGPDALAGRRVQDLLTVGTRILYETNAVPILRLQGFFEEVSLDLLTATGERLPVLASAVERRDARGRPFVRLTLLKAAERRRYERQLMEARRAADELLAVERGNSQLREQFIAVLGHDLRNPLASIAAGARLLGKKPLGEDGARVLGMIQGSVRRMGELIDNLMDFARGRLGGGIGLDLRRGVMLGPVLEQVVEELRAGSPGRAIGTDLRLTEGVDCDPIRIGQMASNLLGNALTHGAADRPVGLAARTGDGALVIAVSNGGTPIPPAAMERLFHPFFRGEVRPSQQGLGLGLHIASEIAKAHRGTLTVESSSAETRFTFRMPLAAEAPPT